MKALMLWVILYAVMGFSAYPVYISESGYRNKSLTIFMEKKSCGNEWCKLVAMKNTINS